jgi:glutamate-1-semialdehyde 2,1-aminomutase
MFDEVLSGFRMSLGGAQEYYGVVPDLCTLAKALGGGFPISAIVGKRRIMDCLNPSGPVAMSGTYTGSLIPVLASVECLKMMREPNFYIDLNRKADLFYSGISDLFRKHNVKGHVRGLGARFGLFFGVESPESDYQFRTIADRFDAGVHKEFVRLALEQGLYFLDTNYALAPTHYGFTAVHSEEDLEMTLQRLDAVFKELGR